MRHNWLASLSNCVDSHKKFCTLKLLLIQFLPVALSVIFLLVYVNNFASLFNLLFYKCVELVIGFIGVVCFRLR